MKFIRSRDGFRAQDRQEDKTELRSWKGGCITSVLVESRDAGYIEPQGKERHRDQATLWLKKCKGGSSGMFFLLGFPKYTSRHCPLVFISEKLCLYPCEDFSHHRLCTRNTCTKESLLQCRRGRRRLGRGGPAAGEKTLDGYVKKDLFHCQNQKALLKSQL